MVEPAKALASWEAFLRIAIHRERPVQAYLKYIRRLLERGLPIIFDGRHFAGLVGLEYSSIIAMTMATTQFYRQFAIPKRTGGERVIATPYPSLLHAQRWIHKEILNKIPLSSHAHGFRSGYSVVSNASAHLGQQCLLRMDLKDFFPSLTQDRVVAVFKVAGYTNRVSRLLGALCCLDRALPQGAATSPALSNIIAKRLDARLGALCATHDVAYTRYADDMVFSGQNVSPRLRTLIAEIIESERFTVNTQKTFLSLQKSKRIVTGVSVSGDKLTLPRALRRQLRQEEFYLRTRGYAAHTLHLRRNDPLYIERLIGRFGFWQQIEPKNEYVRNAILRLKTVQRQLTAGELN